MSTTRSDNDAQPAPARQSLDLFWAHTRELLVITDEAGHLQEMNPRASALLGPSARLGTALESLLADRPERALWQAHIAGVLAGSDYAACAIGLTGLDREVIWVEALSRPLTADARSGDSTRASLWLWQMSDITALRAAQARAARAEERLALAQSHGRLGLWERDAQSGAGRWDANMYANFGFESTEADKPVQVVGVMLDDAAVYELAQSASSATELLKLAADLGQISLWRHDLKTDRMHLNDQAYAIAGVAARPEGLSAEEVREWIHPDDMPRVLASAQQALETGKPYDLQARYRRGSEWRHVLARRVVQYNASGEAVAFVGVGLDLTDQLAESNRAAESARHLELAINAAGVGIWYRDLASGRVQWNAQMFALYGRDPAKGPPDRTEWVETMVHPEDRALALKVGSEAGNFSEGYLELEFRIVRTDRAVRRLATRSRRGIVDGHDVIFGVIFDVTERARAEAALRSANEQTALAARGAGIGTWEMIAGKAGIQWDEQMFRLRGWAPANRAVSGEEILASVHPDDRGHAPPVDSPDFLGAPPLAAEFRVRWPDGSYRWLASRSAPILDEQGRAIRRVGVNWDVTESKTSAIARQEHEIARRESLAKSRIMARMSHELRTPLNAVLGFAQLLAVDPRNLDASRRGHIGHILSAGQHLLALIDDVLDLSSLETGDLRLAIEPADLAELVAQAVSIVHPLARDSQILVATGEIQGIVLCDRVRLRQVLVNLLSNGIKYNRAGGSVTIEAQPIDRQIALRVSDSGRGLTAMQLAHLFEPFNRLGAEREDIQGTGIGLAIVKALLESMRGSIAVSSEPGKGSVFEIRLPASASASASTSASESTSTSTSESAPASVMTTAPAPASMATDSAPARLRALSGKVLYIEDNGVNLLLVEELVRSFTGLSIVSEITGQAGVARAQLLQPDLILIDMQLPDFDGFEVLGRLRADDRTRASICVALSANAMPEDIERARAAGFNDYWTKPIDIDAFLSALSGLFEQPAA